MITGYIRKGGTFLCMMELDFQKVYDMGDWRAMKEIGIPNQFIRWTMLVVTSVSYKFNIIGDYSKICMLGDELGNGTPCPFSFL